MSAPITTREAPWQAGLHAAQRLLRAGLILQITAVGLVVSYYYLPAAHDWFEQLARWRTAGGYVFSAVASALCGGLLPFLYLRFSAADRTAYPWSLLIFFALFWAWKGAEVDLLYRTLNWLFGDGNGARNIIPKVLVDQFAFNPFYATPASTLVFAWKDAGFRWRPVLADLRSGHWYAHRVLPVLISVWAVWIPVVSCVYALPPALQIPLFNVGLCFWSLLFAHIITRQNQRPTAINR